MDWKVAGHTDASPGVLTVVTVGLLYAAALSLPVVAASMMTPSGDALATAEIWLWIVSPLIFTCLVSQYRLLEVILIVVVLVGILLLTGLVNMHRWDLFILPAILTVVAPLLPGVCLIFLRSFARFTNASHPSRLPPNKSLH